MMAVIIYVACVLAVVVFELIFHIFCKRWGVMECQKPQWMCFFWASSFVLVCIALMPPYDPKTLVNWAPMFLVAGFHIQQSHQREIVDRLTGKPGKSGSTI